MRLPFKKYLPHCYLIGSLVLLFLIRITVLIRQKDDPLQLDIYNILQISITFLMGFAIIIRKDLRFTVGVLTKSPIGWLILLYLWGSLSGIWSTMPLFSGYFGIEGLILILGLAVILLNQPDNASIEKFSIYTSYLIVLLIFIGFIRLNGFGFDLYHWHTNEYSAVAAMLFGYCYGELNNKFREYDRFERKVLKYGTWLSLFCVLIGTSSGSNLSIMAALVVVTLISGRRSTKIFTLLIFSSILILNQFYGDLLFRVIFPGKTLAAVSSMQGRLNLWEHYLEMIQQKPWMGWGFASIERISNVYATTTHNSLIEVAGGVGIVGLCLYLIYIFTVYLKLIQNIHTPYLVGITGALTAGLVNSNSISFIGSPPSSIFISFIIWNIAGWYFIVGINQNPQDGSEHSPKDN